jgi:hypothetical protein
MRVTLNWKSFDAGVRPREPRGLILMAEIITCPNCQRQLGVPEQYLGQTVQCPECRHQFMAALASVKTQPAPVTSAPPFEPKPRRDEDDEPEAPPRRRRHEEDDEGDDYEDLDIRHRNRLRKRFDPHRGGVIMALGLIALVGGMSFCLPALIGPIAWILGSWDLRSIRDGHMDPAGESITRAGQVCGIIATVLLILGASFFCLMFLSEMN